MFMYLNEIDKQSIDELASAMARMDDRSVYESIQNIEKLHIQLASDFEGEVQRGYQLGLLPKHSGGFV